MTDFNYKFRPDDRFKETKIREKMIAVKVKITSYLKGTLKNAFMLDCIKREQHEGKLIREIVETHYHIMSMRPDLKSKPFKDIRTDLTKILANQKSPLV